MGDNLSLHELLIEAYIFGLIKDYFTLVGEGNVFVAFKLWNKCENLRFPSMSSKKSHSSEPT